MKDMIVVGISDFKTATSPHTLVTYALGSCIGVSLYDREANIGGMAHIMLPESSLVADGSQLNRMKFADTAIVDLLRVMERQGASRRRITAKIAGGANMFQMSTAGGMGAIGERNIRSVKKVLAGLRIPLIGEDTGKDFGRTVFFDLDTGMVRVQSLGKDIREM